MSILLIFREGVVVDDGDGRSAVSAWRRVRDELHNKSPRGKSHESSWLDDATRIISQFEFCHLPQSESENSRPTTREIKLVFANCFPSHHCRQIIDIVVAVKWYKETVYHRIAKTAGSFNSFKKIRAHVPETDDPRRNLDHKRDRRRNARNTFYLPLICSVAQINCNRMLLLRSQIFINRLI